MIDSLPERITDKIWPEPNSGCWLWSGSLTYEGYGQVRPGDGTRRMARVHRLVWEAMHGPIPAGMSVLHHCDNRACCNADAHLYLGTHADNMLDVVSRCRNKKPPGAYRGSDNGRAKLTPDDVAALRQARREGVTNIQLAGQYGVAATTISHAITGKSWGHLP